MTILLQGAGQQQTTAGSTPSGPLLLDLEADTQSLGALASWAGEESAHHAFTQSTGAAQPIVQVVDGYKAVVFDGVDDWMLGQNWAEFDNQPSFTIFLAYKLSVPSGTGANILSKMNDDTTDAGWECDGNFFEVNQDGSNYVSGDISGYAGVTHVWTNELQADLTTGLVYMDGDSSQSQNWNSGTTPITGYSNSQPVRLGAIGRDIAHNQFVGASIYAIRFYSPALNATDRAAVETELTARYGIAP